MNEKTVRSLALALSTHPRANLQEIAQAAGISKATLYRIAPTRDALLKLIYERGELHLRDSVTHARLEEAPHTDALRRLVSNLIKEREIYLCWGTNLWMHMLEGKDSQPDLSHWEAYAKRMEEFFLAGQRAGAFRIDMSAKWLYKTFDFMVCGAIDAAHRGEIAPADLENLILKQFLYGAIERA